jgi:5'-nucleotidase
VPAQRIAALQFLPEAPRVNAEIARLKARGVNAIVLLLHEGLVTPVTPQPAPLDWPEVSGRLAEIARALDPGVDVIVSAHTHKYSNLMLPGRDGRPVLVTQARSYGGGFSEIDLTIDRATGDVVAFASRILTPWADTGPGLRPDAAVEKLVAAAHKVTAVQESRPVGAAASALTRAENAHGESPLGNLVADAQRAAAGTEFAFMNKGGIRSDLDAGPVTWGELRAVQPFGNTLLRMTLTGEQILRLLEQQWSGPHAGAPYLLRPSGLAYSYDLRRPAGSRVVDTRDAEGLPLDPQRRYTVVANDFLYGGGDHFSVFAEAADVQPVMLDVDALEKFIAAAAGPVEAVSDGRVQRVDAPGR